MKEEEEVNKDSLLPMIIHTHIYLYKHLNITF